ncbi:hypothetical protein LSH36_99g08077 [Paralvinella palmiformis]|uniref:Elongator complex protein 2 n=1 Tax=Paralvinella palmiformis TaxID=53620 RepID=A0AAD9NBT9_9ANNE|nr:hypothetical protein LSH36_99g08077 [Paralvinella palmiformis]
MDIRVVYTSSACNRTPFSADWGQNNLLAYGACRAIIVCQQKFPNQVIHTLTGHKDRINSVQWIRRQSQDGEIELISSSTDKTVIVWRKENHTFQSVAHLVGHTSTVTLARGFYLKDLDAVADSNCLPCTLIATASVDSTVRIWKRVADEDDFTCIQTLSFGTGFALALSWIKLPGTAVPLLVCGGDDQKIHLLVEQETKFVSVQTLPGHEDWIRDIDLTVDDQGDVLLASCSQDHYIRIWRLSSHCTKSLSSSEIDRLHLNDDIQMKKTTFTIETKDKGGSVCFGLTLESVLQGHEGWIYSVCWHPPVTEGGVRRQPLVLLSASIDKTLILWHPDQETGIWIEQVRVGAVGGNTLGFYGGMFSPDGQSIMSHGFQGSFHVWHRHQTQDSDSWVPGITVGGHFASVEDIAWDPDGGEFIISVSLDQTTRLHGYWKSEDTNERSWHELGRPQIHGYDMQCIAMINRWSFASGADEKVIRVFEAPKNFIENLGRLISLDVADFIHQKSDSAAPDGASVPALGLSNKAVFHDTTVPPSGDREIRTSFNPQYPELYFSPLKLNAPPSEDNLLQNTLWPEAVIWTQATDVGQRQGCLGNCTACSVPLELPDSITAVDFAPCKIADNSYLIAFGLDNGSIHIYKWLVNDKAISDHKCWSQVLILNQRVAHHLTVKRLSFRPFVGEVGVENTSSKLTLQLASCGADHLVKIYTIQNIS